MFNESLDISLQVTIGAAQVTVPGGQVKGLELTLQPWGFSGEVSFWLSSETETDTLFDAFLTQEKGEVQLEIGAHLPPEDEEAIPLSLTGVVTQKALLKELTIENLELKGDPVLYRYYRLCFEDIGRALWRQHHPCTLLVEGTLSDLLADSLCGVTLSTDWEPLTETRPINILPGYAHGGASFYDVLVWLSDSHNGALFFDFDTGEYSLAAEKPEGGEPMELDKRNVLTHEVHFPETPRYQEQMLNSFTEAPKTKPITREMVADGVTRDIPGRYDIAANFETRCAQETERVRSRNLEVHISHSHYPWALFLPGSTFTFKEAVWRETSLLADKSCRVVSWHLVAQSDDMHPEASRNLDYGKFEMEMTSVSELEEELFLARPEYTEPHFPIYVEGTVVSEQGGEEDKTYQLYENSDTALEYYKVALPLYEEQEVVALLNPNFATGHFYFPAFKGQRVLVALTLHGAKIVEFLDYRPGAKLPMESQGNHLLLGKTEEDGTSINHVYVDGKPQLNIMRTSGKDKGSMQVQEGTIILETSEE